MAPYSPTSTKIENNNVVSTMPVHVSTPKLSKKMGLMTPNDPAAQCQSPYSLGSLGSAKRNERNSVVSMTLYIPCTTAQSLLPNSPGNGLNLKNPVYILTPKNNSVIKGPIQAC